MIGIETIIDDDGWRRNLAGAASLADRVFEATRRREARLEGEAALLLTSDDALQALNARFRGKHEPTNVLSFPVGAGAPGFLGDIALGYETCAREAAEKGVPLADHAAHLVAHGLLHLVGHDHIDDADAARMQRLEVEILDAIGVSNPYENEETLA